MLPRGEQMINLLFDNVGKTTSKWENATFKEQWLDLNGNQRFREQTTTKLKDNSTNYKMAGCSFAHLKHILKAC